MVKKRRRLLRPRRLARLRLRRGHSEDQSQRLNMQAPWHKAAMGIAFVARSPIGIHVAPLGR